MTGTASMSAPSPSSSVAAIQSQIEQLATVIQSLLSSPTFTTLQPDSPQLAEFVYEALPSISAIRAELRGLSDQVRHGKNEVASVKDEVDERRVKLDNLRYEREMLAEEIWRTRELRSIYQDVDLPSLEEFRACAPEEMRTDAILADEHQLTLNRLQHELAERQRLEDERRTLAREKLGLLKTDRSKAARLKTLEKATRELLEQAVALRDTAGSEEQA